MDITLDVTTLTLGETAKAEMASGQTLQAMLKSPMARLLLALFVHELRTSAEPRSWSELSSQKVLDVSSSMRQSRPEETPAK